MRALLVVALVGFYVGLPAEVRAQSCVPGSFCVSESAIRTCDAAEAALPEARLQLRVAEQRATVATGDALTLSRALDSQSRLVRDLRRELLAARPWMPAWAWFGLGAALGVAGSIVLALSL